MMGFVKLLPVLLVLLPLVHPGSALECHGCSHYKVMTGDRRMSDRVEEALGGSNRCMRLPGRSGEVIECENACKTSFLEFEFSATIPGIGEVEADAEIMLRGCHDGQLGCRAMNQENLDDMIREQLAKANMTLDPIVEAKGGYCACDNKDKCNGHKKHGVPKKRMQCVSCAWVESSNAARAEEMLDRLPGDYLQEACMTDPESLGKETCERDTDRCATLVVDVNSLGDTSGEATIWRRGCVRDAPREGCHNISRFGDQVKELLGTDDYVPTRGGMCFCDKEGCNRQDRNKAWKASGAGTLCRSCSYASAKNRDDAKAIRNLLPESPKSDSKCQNAAGELKAEECDTDEICASILLPVTAVDGTEVENGKLFYRGCVSRRMADWIDSESEESEESDESEESEEDEDDDDAVCHSSRHFDLDLFESWIPDEIDVEMGEGGVCFCNGNDCNKQSSDRLDDAQELVQCVSCSWVETWTKKGQMMNRMPEDMEMSLRCRNSPERLPATSCQKPNQICASMVLDTTSLKDLSRRSKLWVRGCVDAEDLNEEEMDDRCYDVSTENYMDKASILLGTEDFTVANGGICFCEDDDCNVHNRRKLTDAAPRGDCTFDCEGMADGIYNKCTGSCRRYVECTDGSVTRKSSCDKKEEWDSDRQRCVEKSTSTTCP